MVRNYMTGKFARAWWAAKGESTPEAIRLVIDDEFSNNGSANLEFQFDLRLLEEIRKH